MGYKNFIQVASFSFPIEAHIAKSSLESAEIPVFLTNENVINMQWLYSHAMGGVQLFVPEKFEAEARVIIESDFSGEFTSIDRESERICTNCGSNRLDAYTRGKKPAFLVFLLLGFPLFFYRHGFKCQQCGKFNKGY